MSNAIIFLKLSILLFLISFYVGLLYYMIARWFNYEVVGYDKDDPSFYNYEFPANGHIIDKSDIKPEIMLYFSTTTLSTVGFGDFVPINDVERILTAIIMLLGVNCFSYIRSEIINMYFKMKEMN